MQDAFDRFAQWCGQEPACALHGQDVGAVFDAVIALAPVTRTIVPQMLAAGADPIVGWPLVAQMLAEVQSGDTTTLDALTGVVGTRQYRGAIRGSVAGKNGLFSGVLCASFGPQDDYEALRLAGETVAQQAPRFAWKFWDATPLAHGTAGIGDCAGWPIAATNPPHRLQVGAHPNVLVANPTHDPATPLSQRALGVAADSAGAPADRRRRRPPEPAPVAVRVSGPWPASWPIRRRWTRQPSARIEWHLEEAHG